MSVSVTTAAGNTVSVSVNGGSTVNLTTTTSSVSVSNSLPSSIAVTEKGPKGDTGATGATGPQGATGAQGPAGADGTSPNAFTTISVAGQDNVVADATDDTLTIAAGSNVTVTTNASSDTITISSSDTNTQLSTEEVQDIVGAMFTGNTETRIAATYEDSDGTIDLVVDAIPVDLTSAGTGTIEQSNIRDRKFTVTSNTDGDHRGDIVYIGGTTSMTTGALYHFKSDGTWELADADAASTCDGLLGIALGAASDTNGVLLRGMVTIDHDPGSVGDVLFVSTTAGDITATAPSGNGDIVRIVGYCLDASNGQIWFNPDGAFVEVSA